MTRTCSQCGTQFTLTQSETEFYGKKGLHLPKRCKACRTANKAAVTARPLKPVPGKNSKLLVGIVTALIFVAVVYFVGDGLINTGGTGQGTTSSQPSSSSGQAQGSVVQTPLTFRNENLLNQHFKKHGVEMGFTSAAQYEAAASAVVLNPTALHKTEKEDGDDVYYLESTNEFVVVSTDGYIRTYFYPNAGKAYFDRQ